MADKKDTIYIDIDDDITSIIDKLTGAQSKIVALVPPKRATVLQSQVNMKLLKRAADDAAINLVLVTSESGLMPLAAAAGIYIAKTLSSKPEMPSATLVDTADIVADEPLEDAPDAGDDFDARAAENQPIGEITGVTKEADDDEAIELDNSDEASDQPAVKDKKATKNRDKKFKIPNFGRFRNRILLVVLALIGLGVLLYFALAVWPHATINIYTKQNVVPADFTASFSSNANKIDALDEIIPAIAQTEQKSYSQTVPASGQKDMGTPAKGTVDLTVCVSKPSQVPTIPSGTGVSTNNLTYITQEEADFGFDGACPNSDFKFKAQGIAITAQNPGSNYNVSDGSFTVASPYSSVTGEGETTGGTSNIVRVVQQVDIDSAKSKLAQQDSSSIQQILKANLEQIKLAPIVNSFTALPSDVASSANPGDQADNVTVTENVTYVMYGYKTSNLEQLIEANVANQYDSKTQGILDYGLSKISFKLNGTPTAQAASIGVSTKVVIGPKLDKTALKKQFVGKKAGEIRDSVSKLPGVGKVEVNTSPFWVSSVPNDQSKVTINFIQSK